MIHISIGRSPGGRIRWFSSEGHANYSEKGSDVVCAAVSVLVINTINSIEMLLPEDARGMKVETDGKKGRIACVFGTDPSEKTGILLEAMYLGLKDVYGEYGGKYIEIAETKEENGYDKA